MKTYIVKSWSTTRKVVVEDDVQVSTSNYERSENMMVTFSKPTLNYGSDLIAAFENCTSVYLEGTDIQELDYERCESTEDKPKKVRTKKWTPISADD